MLNADCASGPLLVIFDGDVGDLSPESRLVLTELLKLNGENGGALLEHFGSWEAVAEAYVCDFGTGTPALDA